MEIINNFLSNKLIGTLAQTIIHSLWQGLFIALICWIILFFVKKENAQTRYMVNIAGVVSVFVLSVISFLSLYNPASNGTITYNNDLINTVINSPVNLNTNISGTSIISFANNLFPFISLVWIFGAVFFFFKFSAGLLYNHQLKYFGLTEVSHAWNRRLERLGNKIINNKIIKIYESALIKVPTVVGHLKPVILFPVGALSGIPVKQVEAIMAHELAHIKRYDYLINLIQSIMEILFFYHPAVWWMNSKANTEREKCCDDIAMKVTGDRLIYAKALSNIEEASHGNLKLSPAFSGKKDKLLDRIQRLYNKSYEKVGSGRLSSLAGISLLILFIILFSSGVQTSMGQEEQASRIPVNKSIFSGNEGVPIFPSGNNQPGILLNETESSVVIQDTKKKSERKIQLDDVEVDGKKYDVYLVLDDEDNLIELKINGEKIKKEDFGKYDKVVKAAIKIADEKMEELEKEMENLHIKMEELNEEFAVKQKEMQHDLQEKLKELHESELFDERFDEIQNKLHQHNQILHENLKHIKENDLMKINEDVLSRIEELDLIKELDFGRQYTKNLFDKLDIEKYLNEDQMKKFNLEIIDELKNWDLNKFNFGEKEMNKLEKNFRRNLEEMEFDSERFREEFESQREQQGEMLKKLREREFFKQKEQHELLKEIEENVHNELNHSHDEFSRQIEEAQRKLQKSINMFQEQYEKGDINEKDLKEKMEKAQQLFRKNAEQFEKTLQKSMQMQHELADRREVELRDRMEEFELRRIDELERIEENLIERDRDRERAIAEGFYRQEEMMRDRDLLRNRAGAKDNLERTVSVIESELKHDGIIDDELQSFKLTKRNLRVNGKKQSKDIFRKYLDLYEDISGKKLKKEFKIILED